MTRPHDSWAEVYDLAYREEFGEFYEHLTECTLEEIGRIVSPPASNLIEGDWRTQRDRHRQYPPANWHVRDDVIHQVLRRLRHPSAHALVQPLGEGSSQPVDQGLEQDGGVVTLTLVIYMGVARCSAIAAHPMAGGLGAATPAAIVSAAHTERQREARCTLGSLADTVRREGLESPALLVVGEVAGLGLAQCLAQDSGWPDAAQRPQEKLGFKA